MAKIEIQKNVPIPDKIRNRVYPFNEMEVGDSFLCPYIVGKEKYAQGQKVLTAIWRYCRNNKDKKFTSNSTDVGVRVWRIK